MSSSTAVAALTLLSIVRPAILQRSPWSLGSKAQERCSDVCRSQGRICISLAWPETHAVMVALAATLDPQPCKAYKAETQADVTGRPPYADGRGTCHYYQKPGDCKARKTASEQRLICPCQDIPDADAVELGKEPARGKGDKGKKEQQGQNVLSDSLGVVRESGHAGVAVRESLPPSYAGAGDLESMPSGSAQAEELAKAALAQTIFRWNVEPVHTSPNSGVQMAVAVMLVTLVLSAAIIALAWKRREDANDLHTILPEE